MKTKPQKTCPPEFKVEIGLLVWANQNTPGVDINLQTQKMMNHEFPRKRQYWDRVWKNWMIEAYERLHRYQPSHYVPQVDVEMEKLKALRAVWNIPHFRDPRPGETISEYRQAMSSAHDESKAPKLKLVR